MSGFLEKVEETVIFLYGHFMPKSYFSEIPDIRWFWKWGTDWVLPKIIGSGIGHRAEYPSGAAHGILSFLPLWCLSQLHTSRWKCLPCLVCGGQKDRNWDQQRNLFWLLSQVSPGLNLILLLMTQFGWGTLVCYGPEQSCCNIWQFLDTQVSLAPTYISPLVGW